MPDQSVTAHFLFVFGGKVHHKLSQSEVKLSRGVVEWHPLHGVLGDNHVVFAGHPVGQVWFIRVQNPRRNSSSYEQPSSVCKLSQGYFPLGQRWNCLSARGRQT